MATVTASYNWVSGETVTPAKLNTTAAPTVVVANNEVTTAKILDANVTTAKIASNAVTTAKILDANVTNAKLATGIDASKLTTGTLPIARIADDAVTGAKLADGMVVRVLQTSYATKSTHTAVIPSDNTVPLVTEGDQIMSLAITPQTATNKVLVRAVIPVAYNNYGGIMTVFRGSTCIGASIVALTSTIATVAPHIVEVLDAPASGSAVTYSVRVGTNASPYQMYINGSPTVRYYGGASAATLTLTEIKAS
jgi:hypothetical protein